LEVQLDGAISGFGSKDVLTLDVDRPADIEAEADVRRAFGVDALALSDTRQLPQLSLEMRFGDPSAYSHMQPLCLRDDIEDLRLRHIKFTGKRVQARREDRRLSGLCDKRHSHSDIVITLG